jgi:hypothetical protein
MQDQIRLELGDHLPRFVGRANIELLTPRTRGGLVGRQDLLVTLHKIGINGLPQHASTAGDKRTIHGKEISRVGTNWGN